LAVTREVPKDENSEVFHEALDVFKEMMEATYDLYMPALELSTTHDILIAARAARGAQIQAARS
jgi:hypothetical protein